MVTFLFQGDQLKQSLPGLFHSPGPSSLSNFKARDKKVPRTFLFPKFIKDGDGEVAFVLAFVPPAFDGFLGLG